MNAPRNPDALKKAHQLGFDQLEFFGFAMAEKKRAAAVAMEEYAELKRHRENAARLLRMMGATAPDLEEAAG